MKKIGTALLVLVVVVAFSVISWTCHMCGRTQQVVTQELDPQVLLNKYSWFKDSSAQLDKKVADIKIYQKKLDNVSVMYGKEAIKWPRDVRNDYSIWGQEVAGIKASYNTLAADYNAQMAKINWRFTNQGMLPQGATDPLPREYKPYTEE